MFLKNRNIIFKMKISKVTDYAALNSLCTCVQDMKSYPTHTIEPSKIHNGFYTAELVQHVLHVDRVQVRQQGPPWKTSDVLLMFVSSMMRIQ